MHGVMYVCMSLCCTHPPLIQTRREAAVQAKESAVEDAQQALTQQQAALQVDEYMVDEYTTMCLVGLVV